MNPGEDFNFFFKFAKCCEISNEKFPTVQLLSLLSGNYIWIYGKKTVNLLMLDELKFSFKNLV